MSPGKSSKEVAEVSVNNESIKKAAFAGVVVLYYPDETVVTNVMSYLEFLQTLYVIDNSEIPNSNIVDELCKFDKKVKYIACGENKGIAYALNLGATLAIESGADWLLTMDQDSRFEKDSISKMVEYCVNLQDDKVIIVAPEPIDMELVYRKRKENLFTHIVLTSGSMLNLKLYQKNGPFREDFFIDYVDIEYCLRAKRNRLTVLTLKGVIMEHQLGKPRKVLFFTPTNHTSIRRYYITRNRIAVWREYYAVDPDYVRFDMACFVRETAKILLAEDRKLEKIQMIMKGIADALCGKFGKLPEI